MKVALLHDYLIRFGGAERVLQALARMFPHAPIYTLLWEKKITEAHFPQSEIRGSFVQSFPGALRRRHRLFAPLFPTAAEMIDLREYDLVISSSSAFIKGVIVRPGILHISYIHAPSRFLWDWSNEYLSSFFGISNTLARFFIHYLRVWDRKAAERPDILIANSYATQEKIKKYYRRDSEVIYPPAVLSNQRFPNHPPIAIGGGAGQATIKDQKEITDFKFQNKNVPEDFWLVVSYLAPYKRVDLAIEAFNKLEIPLVVIGDGPLRKALRRMAKPHITFLGWQPDSAVRSFYTASRAFVFPGEDDFGMTAVEAMSHGKPVLAYRAGGVRETVREGITGEFFDDAVPEVLADGVRRLNRNYDSYNPRTIQAHAARFSEEEFRRRIMALLRRVRK